METTSDGTDVLGISVRSSEESTGNSSRNSDRISGVEDTGNPRQHLKRARKSVDRLVYNVDFNGGSENFVEPDVFSYVTAAMRGDEFAHLAMATKKVLGDYPEPVTIEEALATPDAEQWS